MSTFKAENFKYEGYVVSEIEEGFYHLQIDRPKTLNAFNERNYRDYGEILEKLDAIEDSKVILVSSTFARAFSSGLNMKEAVSMMAALSDGDDDKVKFERAKKHIKEFQHCIGTPARINTPTIGILNGINYGLALDISSAFSIRIATADARFSIKEIHIGIAADIGSLQRLPNVVNNKSLLNQYALTGATFNAEDATKLGFISATLPDLKSAVEHGIELGTNINQYQQWAIKGTKKCIHDIVDGATTEAGLDYIAAYNGSNLTGTGIIAKL